MKASSFYLKSGPGRLRIIVLLIQWKSLYDLLGNLGNLVLQACHSIPSILHHSVKKTFKVVQSSISTNTSPNINMSPEIRGAFKKEKVTIFLSASFRGHFLGFQETVALNNFWLEAPDSSLSVTCLVDTLRHGYFPRTSATSLLVGVNYGNLMAVYGMLVWKIQATRNTKSIYIYSGSHSCKFYQNWFQGENVSNQTFPC